MTRRRKKKVIVIEKNEYGEKIIVSGEIERKYEVSESRKKPDEKTAGVYVEGEVLG